jgi:outer membrane protein OmpA-like peptidoglycan-associated protein
MFKRTFSVTTIVLTLALPGCATWEKMTGTEKGAAGGAAAGAVVGGVIGKKAGSTAKGAILGAVVGGAAGAAIGHRMDEQAEDLQDKLPNARIERVGEGIQVTFESGILFDVDSDALRAAARSNLQSLATSLKDYDGTDVLVVGHTDATGSDAYNQSLSERRAESARSYLMGAGLEAGRVSALGRGETEPVDTNESVSGRQENRRVEVAIFASEEMRNKMLKTSGG